MEKQLENRATELKTLKKNSDYVNKKFPARVSERTNHRKAKRPSQSRPTDLAYMEISEF